MKVGDCAQITRAFSSRDLHEYTELSGHTLNGNCVPEPLIGALFSLLLGMKLPGMGTMYLKQETSSLKDAFVGELLTAMVEIVRLRPDKYLADLNTTCRRADGQLIASGKALVYTRDVGRSDHA